MNKKKKKIFILFEYLLSVKRVNIVFLGYLIIILRKKRENKYIILVFEEFYVLINFENMYYLVFLLMIVKYGS